MYALPLEDPIYVTTDRNSCSLDAVMQLLGETHWAASRPPETVRLSMENSLCFFMLEGEALIGFARVITDYATFAYLCDVVVRADQQGTGCGSLLIRSILTHPPLQEIPQWRLKTTYAADFYSRFGFQKVSGDTTHMEYYPKH